VEACGNRAQRTGPEWKSTYAGLRPSAQDANHSHPETGKFVRDSFIYRKAFYTAEGAIDAVPRSPSLPLIL
jgi:hypothetical protein